MRRGVSILVLAVGCSGDAVPRTFAAVAGDLAPSGLVVPRGDTSLPVASEAVSHVRALDPDRELAVRPDPLPDRSRRWWTTVTGDDLATGIALPTTAGGATVSLRPVGATRSGTGVDPDALVLVDASGTTHDAGSGMDAVLGWDELRAGDSPFAPGTTAFRIDPDLGAGAWTLRVDAPLSDDEVLVHVVEPDSALVLVARTDATAYLLGHTAVLDVEARRDGAEVEIRDATARAHAPDGAVVDVALAPSGAAGLRGTVVLEAIDVPPGATWTVEVDAVVEHDGVLARRNARVAFAYAVPSAGLDGRVALVEHARADPTLALGVEVVAPGRYAVAATVWGTDTHGRTRPLGTVQSGSWLDEDADAIELPLGSLLGTPGLGAPYELRDLMLVDQSRIALLHRQAVAVAFTAP